MLIRDILSDKPSSVIFTVTSNEKVSKAAKILSENRIGTVIVSDSADSITGILSERDIVREIGRNGGGCLEDEVSSLMTKDVKTCGLGDSIQKAMEIMTQHRFRHLPVVDEGKLVGVISIGDVVAARIKQVEFENTAMADMIAGNA